MRLAAPLLAVAVASGAAACGDRLSLEVSVKHPPEAAVATTAVAIYESNATTCKQIEFGDLSTAELAAILVAEQTTGAAAGGSLDDISRLDRKLVVARGFDAAGRFVTAGCTQKEEITGRDVVPVDTDFAATLSISALVPGEFGIPITLTDAEGRSLGGHQVTWRVYGPDGVVAGTSGAALAPAEDDSWELAAPTCTIDSGVARLHPVPPSRVGGYAIALQPRWPSQPTTLLTSFTRVTPVPEPVTKKLNVDRPCAVRVAGQTRRLVCLQLDAGVPIVREYDVSVQNGNAQLSARAQAIIDVKAIALFAVERTGGARDVYALTTDAQVLGVFQPSVMPTAGPHLPAGSLAIGAALLPACDAGQAPQLLMSVATATDRSLVTMPPLGGAVAGYHGISADASLSLAIRDTGCITELRPGSSSSEPRRRQAAVVDVPQRVGPGASRATTSVVFECDLADRARCRASLPVPETGAGLSPPPRSGAPGEEPRLTGMFFDASGVVMSSWVLLPTTAGEFLLVERERVPAAAIPRSVVSGRFDDDGVTDVFWDLQNVSQRTSNLQITYGRRIGEQRLSALSGAESLLADAVLAGDLTGDGMDDIILLGTRRKDDMTSEDDLFVIPMNVPIANPDPGFDRTCP
jgi:hypothetical protein